MPAIWDLFRGALLSIVLIFFATPASSQTAIPRSVRSQKGPNRSNSPARVIPKSAIDKSIKPQQSITLAPPSTEFIDELKRQDATEGKTHRVRLGFNRSLEHAIEVNESVASQWSTAADGTRVYVIQVASEGALGIRLHLENVKLPARGRLLVYDPANPQPQGTPMTIGDLRPEGDIWMPTVLAATVLVECEVPPGADVSDVRFSVTELSHFYRPPVQSSIREKAECENDVACQPDWANEAAAVAMIEFVEGQFSYQCTGALLNDSDPATFINYFLTAHHCIGSQSAASTIDFSWFYQNDTCGGSTLSGQYTTTSGGADLLATSATSDFAFLRLRRDPPDGVFYLGWSTATPTFAETLTGIHHPQGEPKKISFGQLAPPLTDFWDVQWFYGVTEEGSSGSPLFNAEKRIIGQLYGGASACDNTTGIDEYGRFDTTFRSISRWLSPSGTYNGLFAEADHVAIESSGFINIRLRSSGAISGFILLAGKRYSFSTTFGTDYTATVTINPRLASALTISLALDIDNAQITGTITDGSWTADVTAYRASFNRTTNPSPWQGTYTIVFPGQSGDPTLPAGTGYGTIKIDGSGNLRVVGALADNTRFTQSVPISSAGDWPCFGSLAGGNEQVWSWMVFDTNQTSTDVSGPVSWIKKAQAKTKFYPAGFTNEFTAIGSYYQRRTNSTMRVIDLSSATVSFSGGNLPSDFSNQITIAANNKVTNESANKLSMSFAASTGLFHGSVMPSGLTRSSPFSGAVLQKQNLGYGFLIGTNETSDVVLGP